MSLRDLIHPHLCDCRRQSKSPSSQCRGPRRRPRRTIQKLPSKTKRALSMAIAYGKDLPPVNRSTSFSSSSPCCMLPVERRLNYNAMATQIQTCWRGYRGQILAEIRAFQLSQLTEFSRPHYFFQLQKRLQSCLIEWQRVASQGRKCQAVTTIQRLRRGHTARMRVAHMKRLLRRLMLCINRRRKIYHLEQWKTYAAKCQRLRALKVAYHRLLGVTHARIVCRRVLLQMYQQNRGNVMRLALNTLYKAMLHYRWLEHRARYGIVMYRWKSFTLFEQIRKRRWKKNVIAYWRAWTGLERWRATRRRGATQMQRIFRGWCTRSFRYRTARRIQMFVRQRLSRNAKRRAFTYWLYVEVFKRWCEDAPLWKEQRIASEKRKLYRAAVKRRHRRRARKGKASPLSSCFDNVLVCMEEELSKPPPTPLPPPTPPPPKEMPIAAAMARRSLFSKKSYHFN